MERERDNGWVVEIFQDHACDQILNILNDSIVDGEKNQS
jgi:hypothetical protein